ncbi:MAG TPA: glycosyltransferase, partial [Polyangiaceae bacterium]
MRIALVTTSFPAHDGDPSGHFVRAEARALEADGHEVVVVAPPARGPGGAFGWPGVAARLRENPARGLEALAWVLAARRRVARSDAHRVVAHWAVPCAWPIGLASTRAELVVVSHGGDVRLLVGMPAVPRARIVDA